MSDAPERFDAEHYHVAPDGEFVAWEDYAALRAERDALVKVLRAIAGSSAQQALCEGPTRRLEHLTTMCPHCRARNALASLGEEPNP